MTAATTITSLDALEALYARPGGASLTKEVPRLTPEYRALIEAAPFFAIASIGPGGLDCSPRGDAPGFVHILDDTTLAIPDRRGNNRLDTLRNIVANPRIALLFMIPGVDETLRINGRAQISIAPDLKTRFAVDGKEPATVILMSVETVYFQCSRALVRAKLWDPASRVPREALPTPGQILKGIERSFDADTYDAAWPARQNASLY
jgi:uncharacterized protein